MEGVTRTTAGVLRGTEVPGAWVFRGIPYARSGGAAGRWSEPSPPAPWAGTRDAVSWGPISPQAPPVPGFSLPGDPTHADEDCLNLNVWTPGPTTPPGPSWCGCMEVGSPPAPGRASCSTGAASPPRAWWW